MNLIDEFVNEYKNFETMLRNIEPDAFNIMKDKLDIERFFAGDRSVLCFENALTDIDLQQKIKLVRITRNYVQHHGDGAYFASVSEEEIKFLSDLSKEIESGSQCAGDIVVKIPPVKMADDNSIIAKALRTAFQKTSCQFALPVLNEANNTRNIISWIDIDSFLILVSSGKTILKPSLLARKRPDYIEIIDTKTPVSLLSHNKEYIIEGKGGAIKGIIFRKE